MVSDYEICTIKGEGITADLLVWRRYKRRAPGIVELLLDANPHLAHVHRVTPFLPVNMQIRIPIDHDIMRGKPRPMPTQQVWGEAKGYTL